MQITQLDALTFVGPQISLADVKELKRVGICKIVVARPEGETDDQPAIGEIIRAANAVGIAVHQIPVLPGQITDGHARAYNTFNSRTAGPVFAYCRSGMRATSLWALDQAKAGHCAEDIKAIAHNAGFDLTAMTPRLLGKSA